MADYYPLIARAIAGLDPSAPGESRRALYERARTALIAQLRSVQPPLSESEITRERLSLEEAVRKVESEAAQRAREASRPGGGSGAPRGGDAFRRANARPPESAGPPGAPPGAQRPRPPSQPPSREARPPLGQAEQRPPRHLRAAAPIPTCPIRTTNRWRRPTVTRRSRLSRRRASARGSRRIATASRRSAPAQAQCFRSRARLRSASCSFWSVPASCGASRSSRR